MNCNKCMKFSNTLYDGLCYDCWQAKDIHSEAVDDTIKFNYECPNCKGRYNQPAFDSTIGIDKNFRCPFCGRKMEGLNDQ